MLFHGVVGKDEREGSSPSWFNLDEAQLVYTYVKSLLTMRPVRRPALGVPLEFLLLPPQCSMLRV